VGLKYAVLYDAADDATVEARVIDVRSDEKAEIIMSGRRRPTCAAVRELGVLGDGSVEFQAGLTEWLVGVVERLRT